MAASIRHPITIMRNLELIVLVEDDFKHHNRNESI